MVPSGTLVKMYDYKAPRSNIWGELFKKLEEYLLSPMMQLRMIECRPKYRANVMGVVLRPELARARLVPYGAPQASFRPAPTQRGDSAPLWTS